MTAPHNPDPQPADGRQSGAAEHHEGEIPKDLPQVGTGKVLLAAGVFVVLLVAMFLIGYIPHGRREAMIHDEAEARKDDKPVVQVVYPKRQPAGSDITLAGDVRAMQEASLFPRANGYLTKLNVDIGDTVKKGQVLAEIDTPETDAQLLQARAAVGTAQANITKAQNDFDLSKTTFERFQNFGKTGGVTQQQVDEKQGVYSQATAGLAAAKASLASAQADVIRLEAIQKFQKIYAPFDGKITARNFDIGALLSATGSTELFRIEQNDTLRVFVNVPQAYATMVKVGQAADLVVANYPGKVFTANVSRSSSSIDPATRTMRFQVDVQNSKGQLYGGMYGQVKFTIKPDQPPLIIPTSALIYNAKGMRLAIVDGGKVRYQTITIGRDYGLEVEVSQGIIGSELIVANPGERLHDGGEVSFPPPTGQPAVAIESPTTKPTASEANAR